MSADLLNSVRELAQEWNEIESGDFAAYKYCAGKLIALADRAEAESQREGQQGQWLPIESAPKDGTSILGWCGEDDEWRVIRWRADQWVCPSLLEHGADISQKAGNAYRHHRSRAHDTDR